MQRETILCNEMTG